MNPENPSYTFGSKNRQDLANKNPSQTNAKLSKAIARYLTNKKLQGLSDRTLDQYSEVLRWFEEFIDKDTLGNITKEDLQISRPLRVCYNVEQLGVYGRFWKSG